MKNEIGRKLTSLTIMAIMFAGGMTIAAPSFMPEAASDFSATDGMLSVSSVYIQGAAILEVVVNDPNVSATDIDIATDSDDVDIVVTHTGAGAHKTKLLCTGSCAGSDFTMSQTGANSTDVDLTVTNATSSDVDITITD